LEALLAIDASVETLTAQHADLDFDHVEPAGVFGDGVEFESAQHAPRFIRDQGFVECACRVGRQIVENDAEPTDVILLCCKTPRHSLIIVKDG
jgi:hypothetical protein